jgi:hypothetical protein
VKGNALTDAVQELHNRRCASTETDALGIAWSLPFLHSLERRVNGHGVTVPEAEILFEPGDNFARLHSRFEQTLLLCDLPEVFRSLAGFCLDVVDIRLK